MPIRWRLQAPLTDRSFMAWLHPVARKFAAVLRDGKFRLVSGNPYESQWGVPGWRYRGIWEGRDFYVSQSRTENPDPPEVVARILSNPDNLDNGKYPAYRNEDSQAGLRVEAWYCGRWFQVFTPDDLSQPNDAFRELTLKIPVGPRATHLCISWDRLSKRKSNQMAHTYFRR